MSRKPKEARFLKIRVFLSRVSIQRIFLGHENLSVTDGSMEGIRQNQSLDTFLIVEPAGVSDVE